jgi:Protein of unknown function (DUF4232)
MTSPASGRRLLAAAAMILATAQVAACASAGQQAASPAGTRTSASAAGAATPTPHTGSGTEACGNSSLKPALSASGAAAGTVYYTLSFTNISATSCTLFGYPGVSFVNGIPGRQIGIPAARNPLYSPATVVLSAHGTAHAMVGIAEAANYPPSRCHPTTARALRIYAPGQTAAIYIGRRFAACAARVPVLTVTALRAGES